MTIHIQSGEVDTDLLVAVEMPQAGQTLLVWCTVCGKGFTWNAGEGGNLPPHFCSKACRRRNKVRASRREFLPCPNPQKRRYRAPEEAMAAFKEHTKSKGLGPQPYLCQCGVYHLGNVTWVVLDG